MSERKKSSPIESLDSEIFTFNVEALWKALDLFSSSLSSSILVLNMEDEGFFDSELWNILVSEIILVLRKYVIMPFAPLHGTQGPLALSALQLRSFGSSLQLLSILDTNQKISFAEDLYANYEIQRYLRLKLRLFGKPLI
ncbi:unnamed protein product [Rhizophagus irregularis]|nr:unnamed protein product [Rhizophagus irregularis]